MRLERDEFAEGASGCAERWRGAFSDGVDVCMRRTAGE